MGRVAERGSIERDYADSLASAATGYLRLGLSAFHKSRAEGYLPTTTAAALGTVAVGIELQIKAVLASYSPLLVGTNLPLEARMVLVGAVHEEHRAAAMRQLRAWTTGDHSRSAELNECASALLLALPEAVGDVIRYPLRSLPQWRNTIVHAVAPADSLRLIGHRLAYLALTLADVTGPDNFRFWYRKTKDDERFLSQYKEEQVRDVEARLATARKSAAKLESPVSMDLGATDWGALVGACIVCDSDGILYGDTEEDFSTGEDGEAEVTLTFLPHSFECDQCGLKLDGFEELELAGFERSYDRSVDVPEWLHQGYEDEDY